MHVQAEVQNHPMQAQQAFLQWRCSHGTEGHLATQCLAAVGLHTYKLLLARFESALNAPQVRAYTEKGDKHVCKQAGPYYDAMVRTFVGFVSRARRCEGEWHLC